MDVGNQDYLLQFMKRLVALNFQELNTCYLSNIMTDGSGQHYFEQMIGHAI